MKDDIKSRLKDATDPTKKQELRDKLDDINRQLEEKKIERPAGLRIDWMSEREVIKLLGKNSKKGMMPTIDLWIIELIVGLFEFNELI